ncbi:hypothetical protein QIS74_01930 [Colletotrichum tabaci]|uniref:Uncharacterized protein n=1 Tax=Colletotrichum tabaci TaxID=1209068 RepID=A0AAV9TR74_9PEZI
MQAGFVSLLNCGPSSPSSSVARPASSHISGWWRVEAVDVTLPNLCRFLVKTLNTTTIATTISEDDSGTSEELQE